MIHSVMLPVDAAFVIIYEHIHYHMLISNGDGPICLSRNHYVYIFTGGGLI